MSKARIIFLGAMHDDPSGKDRLCRAVQNLTVDHKTAPEFVAFEWAQTTYTTLVQKRDELTAQLRSIIQGRGQDFYNRFSNTLAYEPDLHMELNQETELIWMLNGSERHDVQIGGQPLADWAIQVKITNLTTWLFPKIHNLNHLSDKELLEAATSVYMKESERLASLTDPDDGLERSIKSGRDSYMFKQLQSNLNEQTNNAHLGIVIVGAGHLTNAPGSLFNLCLDNGSNVQRRWPHEQ